MSHECSSCYRVMQLAKKSVDISQFVTGLRFGRLGIDFWNGRIISVSEISGVHTVSSQGLKQQEREAYFSPSSSGCRLSCLF